MGTSSSSARTATTRSSSAAGPASARSSSPGVSPAGVSTISIMTKWPCRIVIDVSSRLHPRSTNTLVAAATMPGRSAPNAVTATWGTDGRYRRAGGPRSGKEPELAEAPDRVVPRLQAAGPRQLVVAVVGAVEQPRLAHRTEQLGLDGIVLDRRVCTHPARHGRLGAHRRVVHVVEVEAMA